MQDEDNTGTTSDQFEEEQEGIKGGYQGPNDPQQTEEETERPDLEKDQEEGSDNI